MGLYFGVLLIVEKYALARVLDRLPRILTHVYALFFIVIGWVLFRSDTLSYALGYLRVMFTPSLTADPLATEYLMRFWPYLLFGVVLSAPLYQRIAKSRAYAVLRYPLLAVLFYVLPNLDPKKRNYDKFFGSYVGFQIMMMLFMIVMNGICVVEGLRPGTLNIPMVVCLIVSLVIAYVGNIMPKFRMNWNCGIKNPWTLSSETVWTRTHRLGGRLFFAAGVIGLLGAFIPNNAARFVLLFVPVMAAAIVPTVMSYLWFRAEQRG